MAQFPAAKEFYEWVDFFNDDDRARPALPLLIHQEVFGVGFALACDFLKELGYTKFAKPDVHLIKIFVGLELCPPGPTPSPSQVFKSIIRVADNVKKTPYDVDKLFWLVGSGNFYLNNNKHKETEPVVGKDGIIGNRDRREKFIAHARSRLNK